MVIAQCRKKNTVFLMVRDLTHLHSLYTDDYNSRGRGFDAVERPEDIFVYIYMTHNCKLQTICELFHELVQFWRKGRAEVSNWKRK